MQRQTSGWDSFWLCRHNPPSDFALIFSIQNHNYQVLFSSNRPEESHRNKPETQGESSFTSFTKIELFWVNLHLNCFTFSFSESERGRAAWWSGDHVCTMATLTAAERKSCSDILTRKQEAYILICREWRGFGSSWWAVHVTERSGKCTEVMWACFI